MKASTKKSNGKVSKGAKVNAAKRGASAKRGGKSDRSAGRVDDEHLASWISAFKKSHPDTSCHAAFKAYRSNDRPCREARFRRIFNARSKK